MSLDPFYYAAARRLLIANGARASLCDNSIFFDLGKLVRQWLYELPILCQDNWPWIQA